MTIETEPSFTDEQKAEQTREYNAMLIARLKLDLPMPAADKREARRLIKAANAFAKQAKRFASAA